MRRMCDGGCCGAADHPIFVANNKNNDHDRKRFGTAFENEGDWTPMALVTAYLARTAHFATSRAVVAAFFARIGRAWHLLSDALVEAEALRRAMAQRYPHLDI